VSPGVQLPEVTVEYDNINVEADALVGSASIPSLSNVALGILKVSTGLQATRGNTATAGGLHSVLASSAVCL